MKLFAVTFQNRGSQRATANELIERNTESFNNIVELRDSLATGRDIIAERTTELALTRTILNECTKSLPAAVNQRSNSESYR